MVAVVSCKMQVYKDKKWSDNTPRDQINVISSAIIVYHSLEKTAQRITLEKYWWEIRKNRKAHTSSMGLRLGGFTAVFIRAGLLMAYSLFIILLPCFYSNIHHVSASKVGNKLSSIDFVWVFPPGCFCKLVC